MRHAPVPEGKCPPEDVGGTHGYRLFFDSINDPGHEDFQLNRGWLGMGDDQVYTFESPDTNAINDRFRDLIASPDWWMTVEKYYQ
ncbi:plasmid pRiA4b ORF-3 family protein [Echinicola soli]|uniref:Plasmid pRiA4b ORF-3 family protein n=1 Tax=Echinicola soli TaxID=2591634 RepID=A0A514CFW9_9BACT|nr:plasmid pRiA4b ORF-3 family protein [Echinicola soli]QDH78713.1 plasmid pRiA4b ORF-3 family protein [Echinicola soli]